ncbi:MAG: class I SAM-dependent methyltransferase [Hyphomonadaceae bacterium]|nr:class I SAM-dependent methyltransferase [Hyphomonadaceae bacterium]MCA8885808.1 class I SAM-dependent methyltransferase [Hyphomonadaceae bacterium]
MKDASFWDRVAPKYVAQPLADPEAYERTLERTRHYLKSGDVVVEFGCGSGSTAIKLAPAVSRIVASDISSEMIGFGRERARSEGRTNVEFEVATPEAAPWGDASFDAVLAFNLLHLIKARLAALANMHRLLKPNGLFISKTMCLADANPTYRVVLPLMQVVGKAPYVAFLSDSELEREIAAAGFEIIERQHHSSRSKDVRPFLVARRC